MSNIANLVILIRGVLIMTSKSMSTLSKNVLILLPSNSETIFVKIIPKSTHRDW